MFPGRFSVVWIGQIRGRLLPGSRRVERPSRNASWRAVPSSAAAFPFMPPGNSFSASLAARTNGLATGRDQGRTSVRSCPGSRHTSGRVPRACLIGKQTLVHGRDKCTGGLLSSHLILTSPRFKIVKRRSGDRKEERKAYIHPREVKTDRHE